MGRGGRSYAAKFKSKTRTFSVKKYGEQKAALLACKWRVEQMHEHGYFMATEPTELPVAFEGDDAVPYNRPKPIKYSLK